MSGNIYFVVLLIKNTVYRCTAGFLPLLTVIKRTFRSHMTLEICLSLD